MSVDFKNCLAWRGFSLRASTSGKQPLTGRQFGRYPSVEVHSCMLFHVMMCSELSLAKASVAQFVCVMHSDWMKQMGKGSHCRTCRPRILVFMLITFWNTVICSMLCLPLSVYETFGIITRLRAFMRGWNAKMLSRERLISTEVTCIDIFHKLHVGYKRNIIKKYNWIWPHRCDFSFVDIQHVKQERARATVLMVI